jgi:hypothetical protein
MSKWKTEHYVRKKKIKDTIMFTNEISIYKEVSHEVHKLCYNNLEHNPILEQVYNVRWLLVCRYHRNFYKHLKKAWNNLCQTT